MSEREIIVKIVGRYKVDTESDAYKIDGIQGDSLTIDQTALQEGQWGYDELIESLDADTLKVELKYADEHEDAGWLHSSGCACEDSTTQ